LVFVSSVRVRIAVEAPAPARLTRAVTEVPKWTPVLSYFETKRGPARAKKPSRERCRFDSRRLGRPANGTWPAG